MKSFGDYLANSFQNSLERRDKVKEEKQPVANLFGVKPEMVSIEADGGSVNLSDIQFQFDIGDIAKLAEITKTQEIYFVGRDSKLHIVWVSQKEDEE